MTQAPLRSLPNLSNSSPSMGKRPEGQGALGNLLSTADDGVLPTFEPDMVRDSYSEKWPNLLKLNSHRIMECQDKTSENSTGTISGIDSPFCCAHNTLHRMVRGACLPLPWQQRDPNIAWIWWTTLTALVISFWPGLQYLVGPQRTATSTNGN